ncbi:MAG: hypothetical protein M3R67_14515, partial [Acidobacteriota bacterium]|nr:hypothetical protein [Acidobacteriota bacterium]
SIAAMFSAYVHNKARRLEKHKYLDGIRLAEIFVLELNERITGAISEKKRYGWIAYFNQVTDLGLLHRLDATIARFFTRMPDFGHKPPTSLRRLGRAYFEMKFDPEGGYVRNYDSITKKWPRLFEQLSPIHKWTPGGLPKVQSCPRRRASLATNAEPRWATRGAPNISFYAASASLGSKFR